MTPLQLALLIVGVVAAAIIFWVSQRNGKSELKNWNADGDVGDGLRLGVKGGQQLDLLNSGAQFDEFGVGKPRTLRSDPTTGLPPPVEAPLLAAPAKLVTLLLAEREGTHILGMKIHMALKSHGLQFGEGEIYHRFSDGQPVFSVGGLLKPGTLNPADASRFSTPGLALFMSLPGPLSPVASFREFLATAQSLARSLNAEVLDARKKPLTPSSIAQLEQDVELWAAEQRAHSA